MQQRVAGRSGLVVSRLALGTMLWGPLTDEEEAAAQLTSFVAAGGTLVDTADVYGGGESERILGRLLGQAADRDDLLVATKAGLSTGDGPLAGGSSRRHLLQALDGSLRRLGLDHVDLWQLHDWDAAVPVEETLSALDAAVAAGKTRYVGVSNFTGYQTGWAAGTQRAVPGRAPLVTTQMEVNLLERGTEREVLPAAADLGLGVLAYAPLAGGVLTGKYRHSVPADSRGRAGLAEFDARLQAERTAQIVEAVVTAADGLGTSPLAVALSWVRDHPGVTAAIVGPRTVGQLAAALAAESLQLPAEIRAALDDVSAAPTGYPNDRPA